jgi:hypothetical protein
MQRGWGISFVVLQLSLLNINVAAADANAALVGDWYTEGTENNTYEQLIYHRASDGTFWLEGRSVTNCAPSASHIESGTWGVENNSVVQTTSIVAFNPTNYHDTYNLRDVSRDRVEWFDIETDVDWVLVRVPADFKFPLPDKCGRQIS